MSIIRQIKRLQALGAVPLADLPSIPASQTTSGTFDDARIPSVAASKTTSGVFDAARIPDVGLLSGAAEVMLFKKIGANLNSTADQALTAVATTPSAYEITRIVVTNPSGDFSLGLAVGGIYTAASKGGTAVVANTQVYTGLTAVADIVALTIAAAGAKRLTAAALYLSLTTALGSAGTCDVFVFGRPLA